MENDRNSQYNEDELHAPEWLNKEFFENVLRQYKKSENLKVAQIVISPGTSKTDHYGSIMFRVKVNYIENGAQNNTSLIVKTEPFVESTKMDMLRDFDLFSTEILMYSKILPRMTQLLRKIGDETILCAELIYYQVKPTQCLIFEDLVEKGYFVISQRACTLEEVFKVIGILARIHAMSYKLYREGDPDLPKPKSLFTRENMEKFGFMGEGIKYCKEIINNDDDLKKYVPQLEKIEHTLLDEITTYFNENDDQKQGNILVLNHGDFHAKNIMVQYGDGIFKNLMLLDYQACYYGSPVLDLMNALLMMYGPEIRLNHRDRVFSEYVKVFQETLKKTQFNGNIPTKADFEEEWQKYSRWELFATLSFLCFSYIMVDGKIALSDIVEKPEVRKQIWQDPRVLKEMRQQIPRLVEGGYFN